MAAKKKRKLVPALALAPEMPSPPVPTPEEITIDLHTLRGRRLYTVKQDPNGIIDAPAGAFARQKGKALWLCRGNKVWTLQAVAAEVE